MKGFPIHTKSTDSEAAQEKVEPNRQQRRIQASLDRRQSRKLIKHLERQARVAYERTQAAPSDEAAKDYNFE